MKNLHRPVRTFGLAMTILTAALLWSASAQAAGGKILGRVTDTETGEPLAGANVVIVGTEWGAATDSDGRFAIPGVPVGLYKIKIQMMGYRSVVRSRVLVEPDGEVRLDVALKKTPLEMEEVVVTAEGFRQPAEDTRVSVRQISARRVKNMAGGTEDVFRALQSLPGVVTFGDLSTQLFIRGSGPDQNLILMDGLEVPNPYRLYGLVSMFNPETVADIQLMSGGFPAKYGNRLSSVLDIRNRRGGEHGELDGNFNLNITNANVVMEGRLPASVPGSWILSARRTYYDIMLDAFFNSDNMVFPYFRDFQGRLTLRPHTSHTFDIIGIHSTEGSDIWSTEDTPEDINFEARSGTRNRIYGVGWSFVPSPRLSSRLMLSRFSNPGNFYFVGQLREFLDFKIKNLDTGVIVDVEDMPPEEVPDFLEAYYTLRSVRFDGNISVEKYSLREDAVYILNPQNTLEFGLEARRLDTHFDWHFSLSNPRDHERHRDDLETPELLDQTERTYTGGSYFQDQLKLSSRLTVLPGIRYDYSDLNRRGQVSLRFSLSYALDEITTLRGAWGHYYQNYDYDNLYDRDFFVDRTSAAALRPEKAVHWVAGVERWLTEKWVTRVEVYNKDFDDLIMGEARVLMRDGLPDTVYVPTNGATGYARGIELLLEKRQRNSRDRISGWISYAYAFARERRGDVERYRYYDQRHTVNVVTDLRLSRRFQIGLKWRYGSGFPDVYKPLTKLNQEETPISANEVLIYTWPEFGQEVVERLPAYHRLDIRVIYAPRFWGANWNFYLDIMNVYNRKNVLDYEDPSKESDYQREPFTMLPFLPTFGVSLRF